MGVIDFARSYMRWFGEINNVRILIDAACTITDDETGRAESYYLIAPCRGERTHADGDLVFDPGMEFCGIWSQGEKLILRFAWSSDRDRPQYVGMGGQWPFDSQKDTLEIRKFEKTIPLLDADAVFNATQKSSEPMVSRTTIRDERRGLTAALEYPVNTMNVVDGPMRFQVDTGPIVVPNFNMIAARPIESLEVAYVVYNRFDEAEFTVRKPIPIMDGGRTLFFRTDYSELRNYPAQNELFLVDSA